MAEVVIYLLFAAGVGSSPAWLWRRNRLARTHGAGPGLRADFRLVVLGGRRGGGVRRRGHRWSACRIVPPAPIWSGRRPGRIVVDRVVRPAARGHAHRPAQCAEGFDQQARDVHLGHPDLGGDLGLGLVVEEAQQHDLSLPRGRATSRAATSRGTRRSPTPRRRCRGVDECRGLALGSLPDPSRDSVL